MFEMMELGIEMQKAIREVQLNQLEMAGEAIDRMQQGVQDGAEAQKRAWSSWASFWGGGK